LVKTKKNFIFLTFGRDTTNYRGMLVENVKNSTHPTVQKKNEEKNYFDPVTASSLVPIVWVIHKIRVRKFFFTMFYVGRTAYRNTCISIIHSRLQQSTGYLSARIARPG
jgi:hypothetical protein